MIEASVPRLLAEGWEEPPPTAVCRDEEGDKEYRRGNRGGRGAIMGRVMLQGVVLGEPAQPTLRIQGPRVISC